MSDENTEEKKLEGQVPPLPWFLNQLDKIVVAIDDKNTPADTVDSLFNELFSKTTYAMYECVDETSRKYDTHLEKTQTKSLQLAHGHMSHPKQLSCRIMRDYFVMHLQSRLNNKPRRCLLGLWKAWLSWRKENSPGGAIRAGEAPDLFALHLLKKLRADKVRELYDWVKNTDYHFGALHPIAQEYELIHNFTELFIIADLFLKLGEYDFDLTQRGRELSVKAQSFWVEDKLNRDVVIPFKKSIEERKKELAQLKKDTEEKTKELREGIEKAKENEQRMTRNFVQIIGIFAAIIAFIVTMVPTAARLGGASIPIALAGLAIVTAGIIILLAMIFGKEEEREKLKKGFWGAIGAFGAWLILTLILAFAQPNVLRPPPDPVRVDTLYIDTVDTTPPPTPSTKDGD